MIPKELSMEEILHNIRKNINETTDQEKFAKEYNLPKDFTKWSNEYQMLWKLQYVHIDRYLTDE